MPSATVLIARARWVKAAPVLRATTLDIATGASNGFRAPHLLLPRPRHATARPRAVCRSNHVASRDRSDDSDSAKQLTQVIREYEALVSRGTLLFDPLQRRAAKKLSRLQLALQGYDHAAFLEQLEQAEQQCEGGDRRREASTDEQQQTPMSENTSPSAPIPVPRGFYIHGDVGTGKSLLLNTFYEHAPVLDCGRKRRLHFHSFLQEIHQRIHGLNTKLLQTHGRKFHVDTSRKRNPILQVAAQLSKEITLLCIDEFQVTDVADAMMLSQFFGELWRRGVVVVATSNRPPRTLYEGGLNRDYFLPFLDALERYCVVHHLGDLSGGRSGGNDYRRIRSGVDAPGSDQCGDYFYLTRDNEGTTGGASQTLDHLFHSFQSRPRVQEGTFLEDAHVAEASRPLILPVHFQRTISVSRYHSNVVALFTFDELCATELGSSDYHAIANHFRTILISDIPQLTLRHPDRARRFITLIDELYEAGCCLACSAVDIPDRLFVGQATPGEEKLGRQSTADPDESMETRGENEVLVDVAQVRGTAVSELASVKELSFAFSRAASRLLEMCSKTWWEEKSMNDDEQFLSFPRSEAKNHP